MSNLVLGVLAIGLCLVLVAWQEYRRCNARDGALLAGAGTVIVLGGAAFSLFTG